jgi:hypothetical protein
MNFYARDWLPAEVAPYDPDLALKLASGADGKVTDIALNTIISALVQVNSARAIEWAPGKVRAMKPGWDRLYTAVSVGLAAWETKPELARQMYGLAKDGLTVKNTETPFPPGFPEAILAALAEKVAKGDADKLADSAIEAAKKFMADGKSQSDELITAYAELAGKASPRLVRHYVEQIDVNQRARALARAIPHVALSDAKMANTMLSDIDQIPVAGTYRSFASAACFVIEQIGKTDPAAALKIARGVISNEHRAIALAMAARAQMKEAALPILREAAAAAPTTEGRVHILSRVAAIAYEIDPTLGKELFAEALKATNGEASPAYVFYYSQVNPAECKTMIDSGVAALKAKGQDNETGWRLQRWALAAAAVDVDKAVEIAKGVPGSLGFDGRRKIAQYVLASNSVRRTMPFDRWCASDTWMPGTPTGW